MNGAAAIADAICSARKARPLALAPFLTAGFPSLDEFPSLLGRVADVADLVEVGVPFSDPLADGVTIQRASHAALEAGVSLRWILETLAASRVACPVVLMSYVNPLLSCGPEAFAERAAAAGVAGLIVPDLPLEERALLGGPCSARGIALIQLVTPVTSPARLARIAAASEGFVYAVTRTGTTGGAVAVSEEMAGYLDQVRRSTTLPVLAGFGIRTREQLGALAAHCDGVVIGSALVEVVARGEDPVAFLTSLSDPEEEQR